MKIWALSQDISKSKIIPKAIADPIRSQFGKIWLQK
jgi:hypothetical protein